MITEWVMIFLHGLVAASFGALGALVPAPPSFWTDAMSAFQTVDGVLSGPISYFLPWHPVLLAGVAMLALTVALGLLRLARRVLSLLTGGGGNA